MYNKPSNTTNWCPYKLYYWQDDMFRSIKGPSSGPWELRSIQIHVKLRNCCNTMGSLRFYNWN